MSYIDDIRKRRDEAVDADTETLIKVIKKYIEEAADDGLSEVEIPNIDRHFDCINPAIKYFKNLGFKVHKKTIHHVGLSFDFDDFDDHLLVVKW